MDSRLSAQLSLEALGPGSLTAHKTDPQNYLKLKAEQTSRITLYVLKQKISIETTSVFTADSDFCT